MDTEIWLHALDLTIYEVANVLCSQVFSRIESSRLIVPIKG